MFGLTPADAIKISRKVKVIAFEVSVRNEKAAPLHEERQPLKR